MTGEANADTASHPTVFYRARIGTNWAPTYVSSRLANLTGDLPNRWVSDPELWLARIHPEDRSDVIATRIRAGETGGPFESRYRLRTSTGKERAVIDQGEVLDDGLQAHGVLIPKPMRDERNAESIRVLVHDLRSPLAAAAGLVQTLLRPDMNLNEDSVRELLLAADRSLANLGHIASSALALENVHSEMRRSRSEPTDLVALIADVVDHLDHADDVTYVPPATNLDVAGHPRALREAVRCLIQNGIDHTPIGTAVTVEVRHHGRAALLTVDDDGPGVPEEYREVIFEPFERGMSPQSRGGLGLGLAVVQHVARAHGGVTWVEETPDGGASFRMLLPLMR